MSRAALSYLSSPDHLEFTWDDSSVCVIMNDGGRIAYPLARRLMAQGWRLLVLNTGGAMAPEEDVPSMHLEQLNEGVWHNTFAEITRRYGRLAAFIDDNSTVENNRSSLLLNPDEESRLKAKFFMAKHLKQWLGTDMNRAWYFCITHIDGKLALDSDEKTQGVVSAGIFSLMKTLRHEWPNVFCRAIDLHPGIDVNTAVDYVTAELFDANFSLAEVGYSRDGRNTITAQEIGYA